MIFAAHLFGEWGVIPTIVTAFGILLGVGGAIVAWRKAKPEASHILVDAAQDVVVIQKGYIKRQEEIIAKLTESLADAHTKIEELQKHTELRELRRMVETLTKQNATLRTRLAAEIARSKAFEKRLLSMENGGSQKKE